jgi:hypothetical protein
MMKMIPNGNGTVENLVDRESYTITQSVDLAATNVEEFDDLGVAVFLQSTSSKEIYQSLYSSEDAVFNTEAHLSSILVNSQPIPGFDPNTFD